MMTMRGPSWRTVWLERLPVLRRRFFYYEFGGIGTADALSQVRPMDKKRILIIDDEDTIAFCFSMVLEASGHFLVRTINSGALALVTARDFAPHLIILDWYLGDGHGLDIAAELRGDDGVRDVPIVFLTGSLSKDETVNLKFSTRFPVLRKPISGAELVASALRLAA